MKETACALALHVPMGLMDAYAVPPSMAGDFFQSKAFENHGKNHAATVKALSSRLDAIVNVLCQLPKAMR